MKNIFGKTHGYISKFAYLCIFKILLIMKTEITTLEDIKSALIEAGQCQTNEIPDMELIYSIAKALLNRFCIVKGNETYRFAEIEFYHNKYDPKNSTRKTYDRGVLSEGKWFFHPSGVDITFASDNNNYGGILVRTIIKEGEKKFVCGPQNVVCELFDAFDAIEPLQNFPHIEIYKHPTDEEPINLTRYNFDDQLLGFCLPQHYWENCKDKQGKFNPLYPWYVGTNELKSKRKPAKTV